MWDENEIVDYDDADNFWDDERDDYIDADELDEDDYCGCKWCEGHYE